MNNNLDIIFFGDSLTFGYGVPKEKSWVYKTAHELQMNYMNKGKNGDTTSAMLSRYYSDVLCYNPSQIFIMGGTNDLLCGRDIDYIIDNIEIMIKDALNMNSKIIIGIPPVIIKDMANELFCPSSFYGYADKELNNLHIALIRLCQKYPARYVDFYSLPLNKKELFTDGVHLNSLGNDIMFRNAVKCFGTKNK